MLLKDAKTLLRSVSILISRRVKGLIKMALRWPRVLSVVTVLFCAVNLCSSLPECIILDPLDRASFDLWTDCGNGKPTLTVKEYKSEVAFDPYDPEAKFVFTNTGSGEFCIKTGLVSSLSDNLRSQIVYRVDQGSANLQVSLLDETDTSQMDYFLFGVGDWYSLDDWLSSFESYKVSGMIVILCSVGRSLN